MVLYKNLKETVLYSTLDLTDVHSVPLSSRVTRTHPLVVNKVRFLWQGLQPRRKVGPGGNQGVYETSACWVMVVGRTHDPTDRRGGEGSSSPSDNSSWDWRRCIFLFVCDLLPPMKLPVVSCLCLVNSTSTANQISHCIKFRDFWTEKKEVPGIYQIPLFCPSL